MNILRVLHDFIFGKDVSHFKDLKHEADDYYCASCKRGFKNKGGLGSHRLYKHGDNK